MKLIKIAFLLMILLIAVSGCEDDRKFRRINHVMNVEEFPNEVGMEWTYAVYDSLTSTSKIVNVEVGPSNVQPLDYGLLTRWYYKYEDHIDTFEVHTFVDTITFSRIVSRSTTREFRLVFPLELNSHWDGGSQRFIEDSCEVVDIDQVYDWQVINTPTTPPIGPIAFHIERGQWGLNEYGFKNYWVIPHFGFVKFNLREILWTVSKNETWRLIDFHQNTTDSLFFEDFPVNLGTRWTYRDYDMNTDTVGELIVTIIDSLPSMIEGFNELWEYNSMSTMATTSSIIDPINQRMDIWWEGGLGLVQLDYPIYPGKKWIGFWMQDSTECIGIEYVQTPIGNFENAFVVTGSLFGFDDTFYYKAWIVKGLGIVKIETRKSSMMLPYESHHIATLKDYTIIEGYPKFTTNKFPMITGSWWNYAVYNNLIDCDTSNVDCFDSMHVAIKAGTVVGNGIFVQRWEYSDSQGVDTEYVYMGLPDTVFFSKTLEPLLPYKMLVFPIEVGNGWSARPSNDTSTVVSIDDIFVHNGRFGNAFNIYSEFWCGDECGNFETTWMVPYVGLVQKQVNHSEYLFGNNNFVVYTDETWKLLNYYIPLIWIDCTQANDPNMGVMR